MQHLNSIYDLLLESIESYSWKYLGTAKGYQEGSNQEYGFSDENRNNYIVEFMKKSPASKDVELKYFVVNEDGFKDMKKIVNVNVFRTLETVFGEILKDYLNKNKWVNTIIIQGLGKDLEKEYITQRTKMYTRYLQRNPIPGYKMENNENIITLIKNNFLTEELKDDFDVFKDRYTKSEYISKRTKTRMEDLGIDYKDLMNIESRTFKCIDFLKDQDIELLQDILQYAKDEIPDFIKNIVPYFTIDIEKHKSGWRCSNDIIFNNFKPNQFFNCNFHEMDNRNVKNFVMEIIEKIGLENVRKIKSLEQELKNPPQLKSSKKDNKGWISRQLSLLKASIPFKDIRVVPIITLRMDFNIDIEDGNELLLEPLDWITLERISNILKSEGIIDRYLMAIGYDGTNFEIKHNRVWNVADFKIKINI